MKHYTAAPGEDNFIGEGIMFVLHFLLLLLFLVCYNEIFLLHYIDQSLDYPYEH